MDKVVGLFKSHYSIGRSVLTLEKTKSEKDADSILLLNKSLNREHFFLVEDSMSGFLECFTHCKDLSLDFSFGLRLSVTPNLNKKDEDSLSKQSKYVIFANNTKGYQRLCKIYTKAATDGFYYEPRTDFKSMREHWDNEDLSLCVPFYDSFICKNTLHGANCFPDFQSLKASPTFFLEDNELPFDDLLQQKVLNYTSKEGFETQEAQTILYNKKADFKNYLTFRCIDNRSTLEKPNLNHMTSDTFCLERWLEKNS